MKNYKLDYFTSTKDLTIGQQKAWRNGGVKYILALLVKDNGIAKVREALKEIETIPELEKSIKDLRL